MTTPKHCERLREALQEIGKMSLRQGDAAWMRDLAMEALNATEPCSCQSELEQIARDATEEIRNIALAPDSEYAGRTKATRNIVLRACQAAVAAKTATWIKTAEEPPTEQDADCGKDVWAVHTRDPIYVNKWQWRIVADNPTILTHWQRTNLTRPEPPKEGE